jgi:hypothetical protein
MSSRRTPCSPLVRETSLQETGTFGRAWVCNSRSNLTSKLYRRLVSSWQGRMRICPEGQIWQSRASILHHLNGMRGSNIRETSAVPERSPFSLF